MDLPSFPTPNSNTWRQSSSRWQPIKELNSPASTCLSWHYMMNVSGFADAQSDSDSSDGGERIPTEIHGEEVEQPDLSARRTNPPPNEPPPMNEERAKITDHGIDVCHFAPKVLTPTKALDHQNISEQERESFLKICSKRLLRCLRHEVPGCNIAM